ncbi:uncharacterized protein LOC129746136 [Uranotaenia lowii]|uniref:uncharacterized protein LOC129746136 n=1 Tax=Uranotaenia lowii TaxID=190385 RepID=UPI002479B303|nr:uncharacterized protein LOC129746136 [Uranotaenia lowii]
MSIPLDAREILNHLNQLGYRNITPQQLKEFQKDLRKLIKFDTKIRDVATTPVEPLSVKAAQQMDTFQRLHTLTTISYNAKTSKKSAPVSCPKAAGVLVPAGGAKNDGAVETDNEEKENAQHPSAAEKVKKQTDRDCAAAAQKMWIRPRSASRASHSRKNDPVTLYQSYQKDWLRFRNQLPGENTRSDLRWQVRTKLLADN